MKKQGTNRFIILLGAVALIFFGGGALGIVWMRMEISTVARNCGKLEGEMEIVSRGVQVLRGQRSKSLRPSSLAIMVNGRLHMPVQKKTFHVSKLDMDSRLGKGDYQIYSPKGEFAGTR
jgi:hypothetical protein